ncbi:CNNM domain-containing protein [Planctomicrobium piriforme]|uniref:Hemolysin, contains CBS domains n=1 Tax=Planctomicrobium piriforme TaxID=1576369 RepID=A0A1I3FF10_9PLAN|nr:CNNM domain-containing protein [Planctomicrobium piriforme]SFI09809.1 Hemolysin, contains CBS domains [Planctomicrobium piriforme]
MPDWLQCLSALMLFAVGIRLSAFFSGSETGFYRLSVPRLSIDARAGDRPAQQLLWFIYHPTSFVATCLIGNNVANYICTGAISSGIILLFGATSETLEVFATLVMAPVIFVFGELLPKSIYYLVPYSRLKKGIRWLQLVYFLFLPITWPLVQFTRFFEWISGETRQSTEILRGRNRLVQLMHQGRREGVLTDLQSRVANGLLQMAPQTITASMIPNSRVLGISEAASRKEILEFARKFGISAVSVHRKGDESAWYGYVVIAELILAQDGPTPVRPMPTFTYQTSKLEALHKMQVTDTAYGVVIRERETLGIVARNGLVEQLFRPELGTGSRVSA